MTNKIAIPLSSPKLTIAMAQVEGPLPNGKHRAYVDGRDTFLWKSREDVNARIENACKIIDFIHTHHPEVNLVVFPEYSIPIEEGLEKIREKSIAYNLIIIPGADNIKDGGRIYNRCPVLIPGLSTPIWVTKRDLSQWEKGFVDEPETVEIPTFHWNVGEQEYWLSIYVCLDLALAPDDPPHRWADPGLYIVPMCSPDIDSIRTIGDFLLRSPGGRVCVLCNAVDESAPGSSSVMAVTVEGKRAKPAMMLPQAVESLLIFEVNCDSLVLPKKSSVYPKVAIGRRNQYKIIRINKETSFIPADIEGHVPIIGVLNPALFEHRGMAMRTAFIDVRDYAEVLERGTQRNFEILAILGQHDIMITHLSPDTYEMAYDVREVVGLQRSGDTETDEDISTSLPHFEVEKYFKVLGKKVLPVHRKALRNVDGVVPTNEEWEQLFSLAINWETASIDDAARKRFKDRNWILGETKARPGDIGAILTIYLDHASAKLTRPFDVFEDEILPLLTENPEVTSAYGGSGRRVDMHYVVRLTTSVDKLFPLIEEIHQAARRFKILIRTSTYVVVRKISRLSLKEACLRPVMAPGDRNYTQVHLFPYWNREQREAFSSLPEAHQRVVIRSFQKIDSALDLLAGDTTVDASLREWRRKAADALREQSLDKIVEIHFALHTRTESLISDSINSLHSDEELAEWLKELRIPPKSRDKLTFGEKIRLLKFGIQKSFFSIYLQQAVELLSPVVGVRNSVVHNRVEELSMEGIIDAIDAYCKAISEWNTWSDVGRRNGRA